MDLHDKMLLGIILFPLLARFNLICRMWAFQIIHDRPLGRADWAFVLGWRQGFRCFTGCASPLGLASGSASLFFIPYQYLILNLTFKLENLPIMSAFNVKTSKECRKKESRVRVSIIIIYYLEIIMY